jgi:hypothetical protein
VKAKNYRQYLKNKKHRGHLQKILHPTVDEGLPELFRGNGQMHGDEA